MYKISISLICNDIIARVYSLIFKQDCPRLSEAARKVIPNIGHCYLEERSTYIIIFRAIKAPYLLPIYVPDKLVLGEICYHTILQGFNASLVKDKNRIFIPYGFYMGYHFMKDTTQVGQETQSQIEYIFSIGRYIRHDPRELVTEHASQVVSY
jgi:hypothetical protein